MTVKVKLTKAVGGHKKDATIEVTEGSSEQLIASGYASKVQAESKPKKTVGEAPRAKSSSTAG